jgi:hypothetical protein
MIRYLFLFILTFLIFFSCKQHHTDSLIDKFRNPPSSYKPWVYWYWIDENISREGITNDLEAMARVGIGKALIGHVSPGTSRGDIRMLSETWWDMVEHAVREGQRVGVDIGFFNSPGWSQSGGPWISRDQSMKYVVSREQILSGPAFFLGNISFPDPSFEPIALIAYPSPGLIKHGSDPEIVRIITEPEFQDAGKLFDRNDTTHFLFPENLSTGKSIIVDVKFKNQTLIQSICFDFLAVPFRLEASVQIRNENGKFRNCRTFIIDRRNINFEIGPMRFKPASYSLPAINRDEIRIALRLLDVNPGAGLTELYLNSKAVIDQVTEKQLGKMYSDPLPPWNAYLWSGQDEPLGRYMIDPHQIVDLTNKIDSAGNLSWEVPEGTWTLLYSGMLPTGATNVPVPPEARGFECDKFTEEAIETHFNGFIGEFLQRVPPNQRKSLQTIVIDSYEVGPQNWTGDFRDIFMDSYGYDPLPWLPVFKGNIVESADLSNRFLWDVRRLTADLISNVYVRRLRDMSNENGMDLWLENYGHWGFPAEFLQYGGQADLVSGEFWYENHLWDLGPLECRAASSAAHTYGKTQVFAEAFTAGFNFRQYPAVMKTRGDQMFCEGINHFVQHVYIHQPWEDRKPGVTTWFGMSYQRHNTWFEQSRVWNRYLQRCHYLLQQGLPVSDICYFIGEDVPKMTGILEPSLPQGFDYDFINADVILTKLFVQDGLLMLPDGKSYALMVLPPLNTMRPKLLYKIKELMEAGASIYGPPPSRSPSMENFPDADAEVSHLAGRLWDNINGTTITSHNIGKGRLFFGENLDQVFEKLQVEPDFICPDTTIRWTHRKSKKLDLYFLSNPEGTAKTVKVSFRVSGKIPEIGNPVTGTVEKVAFFDHTKNRTFVPISMDPCGSLFIIFREPIRKPYTKTVYRDGTDILSDAASNIIPGIMYLRQGGIKFYTKESGNYLLMSSEGEQSIVDVPEIPVPFQINGSWDITFSGDWDAPENMVFDRLISWTEHPDTGIRHFSGTAVYRKKINIPEEMIQPGQNLILDLGNVLMMAEVIVNGKNLGIQWKNPYQLNLSEAVKSGENELEIRVTNTWWNRLVGDEKYPQGFPGGEMDKPKTYTTHKAWNSESELMPAGLIGPVRIIFEKEYVLEYGNPGIEKF